MNRRKPFTITKVKRTEIIKRRIEQNPLPKNESSLEWLRDQKEIESKSGAEMTEDSFFVHPE
jgi:hypothetical protein